MLQIVLADLSMSLDNVLAVAGAAEGHVWVLVVGLAVSVVLMGVAASAIAALLERYRWIAWVGLLIVLYVALKMIWDGGHDVLDTAWPGWLHPPRPLRCRPDAAGGPVVARAGGTDQKSLPRRSAAATARNRGWKCPQ